MPDILGWLTSLGLERFVKQFHAAEIELDTIQHLTEGDLRDLGLPIGPRRKILAALENQISTTSLRSASLDLSSAGDHAGQTLERRQLTVAFVDLVGSTDMSVRFDPEVLSEVLVHYKKVVAQEVVRSGGVVAKYLGDGVLAYFGWPTAREEAAEFAIHCALSLVDRVGELRAPDDEVLACRIGIATGLVVVGGETGTGTAREDVVAGEALNMAARLQSLAAPGEVVIADATRQLVGNLFDWEDRGRQNIKGFELPVSIWRVLRPTTMTTRFEAVRTIHSSLVGRDDELALLAGRWAKASAGNGRAVLVLGEAGIGKSRLCQELYRRIENESHNLIVWQCSAYHQTSALYPVIEYITTAAEIEPSDTPALRLQKLDTLMQEAGLAQPDQLALIAELLSITPHAGYEAPDITPAQRRAATIATTAEWIECLAEQKPLLLLVEDGHWSDASTLDLISSLIGRITGQRLLIVATGRPEFSPSWQSRPQVSSIGLDRLSKRECETLVRKIANTSGAKTSAIDEIVAKGDGNPLFIEELCLAMRDTYELGAAIVPESLQNSLMSRLDMLGEAKEVAQVCSVLGRRFARPLLARLLSLSHEKLEKRLATLVSNDILHPVGRTSEGRYEFKHALVRDAAYGSLLLSRRRRLHESCAKTLDEHFPETARTEPELLAYHFRAGGSPALAARYYEQAGDRAAGSSAFVEAISNYRIAIDQLALVTQSLERDQLNCALLLKLGPALSVIDGAQAPSVGAVYRQAETISLALGDTDGRFKSVWGLWYHANVGRQFDAAERRAQTLVDLAEESGDGGYRLEAIHCRWSSALFRGDYRFAINDATRGTQTYKPELHHILGPAFGGHDPGVCAHGVCSNALAFTGRFAESAAHSCSAISLAEKLDHPHSLAHALMVSCAAAAAARDHLMTQAYGERLYQLALKFSFPPLVASADFFLGWADAEGGNVESGLSRMRSVFQRLVELGPMPLLYTGLLAEQLVSANLPEEALAVTNLPLGNQLLQQKGMFLPEVYRTRGLSLALVGKPREADADLKFAYTIAKSQGSPLFRARALKSRIRTHLIPESVDEMVRELSSILHEHPELGSSRDLKHSAADSTN